MNPARSVIATVLRTALDSQAWQLTVQAFGRAHAGGPGSLATSWRYPDLFSAPLVSRRTVATWTAFRFCKLCATTRSINPRQAAALARSDGSHEPPYRAWKRLDMAIPLSMSGLRTSRAAHCDRPRQSWLCWGPCIPGRDTRDIRGHRAERRPQDLAGREPAVFVTCAEHAVPAIVARSDDWSEWAVARHDFDLQKDVAIHPSYTPFWAKGKHEPVAFGRYGLCTFVRET